MASSKASQSVLYLALFGLLSSLVSLFSVSPASATSIYDSAYTFTDTLSVKSLSCATETVTNSWRTVLADAEWYGRSDPEKTAGLAFIDASIENGDYFISQYNAGDDKYIQFIFTERKDGKLAWSTDRINFLSSSITYSVVIGNAEQYAGSAWGCDLKVTSSGAGNASEAVDADQGYVSVGAVIENFRVFVNNPNYPEDYAGELLATGDEPILPTLRPDFNAQVDNKKLTAHVYENDPLPTYEVEGGYTLEGNYIGWTIYNCGDSETCETPVTEVDVEYVRAGEDFKYEFTEYAWYKITAEYYVQECFRYPSYPATPDHCFFASLESKLDDYNVLETTVVRNVDGKSYTFDTYGMICDENGVCSGELITCDDLETFIEKMNCKMNKNFNTGLINPSINAFKGLLTSMTVPDNPACIFPLQDVAIINEKVYPLDEASAIMCAQAIQFRSSFPIVSQLLNFSLAITILFMIAGIINKLMNPHDTEIVQVNP